MLQDWIAELHRLGPQNMVLAIAGNKSDLEDKREVNYLVHNCYNLMAILAWIRTDFIEVTLYRTENQITQ